MKTKAQNRRHHLGEKFDNPANPPSSGEKHSDHGGKPNQTEWKQEANARRGTEENPE
ncbi:MAG TPA: hypothetical protein VFV23_03160 [Verrucomicrobiae bacterium]|nr:hypothetical protein [Verrucomicrobiae bacterium]